MPNTTCPYCLKEFNYEPNNAFKNKEEIEIKCPGCAEVFLSAINISISFSDEHKIPVNTHPIVFTELFKKRFLNKIKINEKTKCWEWTGTKNLSYGMVRHGCKLYYAHRISFMLFNNKEIKKKRCICHICDNTICVNPEHLFEGTISENIWDARKKGKMPYGVRIKSSKLNDEKVRQIKQLYKPGEVSYRFLAGEFDVSENTIMSIINGKSWKHVYSCGTSV